MKRRRGSFGKVVRHRSQGSNVKERKRKSGSGDESDQLNSRETGGLVVGSVWSTSDQHEEDFPRGMSDELTPLEKRALKSQAQRDVLFAESGGVASEEDESPSKPAGKKDRTRRDDLLEEKVKKLPFLSPKRLEVGTLILGAVREIGEYDVIVSLPFNMVGSVGVGDISDPLLKALRESLGEGKEEVSNVGGIPKLSRLFYVGQLLPCCVLEAHRKNAVLSVNPKLVNARLAASDLCVNMTLSGCIQSVEDHGYVVDFGIADKVGFLLKKDAAELLRLCARWGKALCTGQVISCSLLPSSETGTRSVPVSANPSVVGRALLAADSAVTASGLVPGLLVNAVVKRALPTGLSVGFLGGFGGCVHLRHLADPEFSTAKYRERQRAKARLLWIDPSAERVGLSLQREIVAGAGHRLEDVQIGQTFHEAEVLVVEQPHALTLRLGNGAVGYAPISLVYEEKTDRFHRRHSVGSRHSCRVVQLNLMDGAAVVSLRPTVLDRPFMTLADVRVGEVVTGEVLRLFERGGMLVGLTSSIRGFCPQSHLADVHLKQPRKKLKVGSKVKCRVLRVDPERKSLLLTHKRSLVASELPPLTEYSQAVPGTLCDGTVVSVKPYGLVVSLYGGVTGVVTRSRLSAVQLVTDPEAVFEAGQVVRCRVVNCEPDDERLGLSLRLDDPAAANPDRDSASSFRAGQVLSMEVTGVSPSGVTLVHAPSGDLAFLPTELMSDYPHFCREILGRHGRRLSRAADEGKAYVVHDLLVVSERSPTRPALVSSKRLMVERARSEGYPQSFSDIEVKCVLPCFVKRTVSYGCFVELPSGLVGLAPTKYLSDEFITDTSNLFRDMQSVLAKVLEVDAAKGTFVVSLRCSDLRLSLTGPSDDAGRTLCARFEALLEERDELLASLAPDEDGANSLVAFEPGSMLSATVKSVKRSTVRLLLETGLAAEASVATVGGAELERGARVTCCVLDACVERACLAVSLNPRLTRNETPVVGGGGRSSRKSRKIGQQMMQPGMFVSATIEYVTPYYVVISCSTLAGVRLAYGILDTGQLGVFPPGLKSLKVGSQVSAVVISPSSVLRGKRRGLPVVMVSSHPGEQLKGSPPSKMAVSCGDVVSVSVRDVLNLQANVRFGLWRGRVHATMATDRPEEGKSPLKEFSVGDVVKGRILAIRSIRSGSGLASQRVTQTLELTTKPSVVEGPSSLSEEECEGILCPEFSVGQSYPGVVHTVNEDRLILNLTPSVRVSVSQLLVSKEPVQELSSLFTVGRTVTCMLISSVEECKGVNYRYTGSLVGEPPSPAPGMNLIGRIRKVAEREAALLVELPGGREGRVAVSDLSDRYLKSPLRHFGAGKVLKFCVVDVSAMKIGLSLRESQTGVHCPCLPKPAEDEELDKVVESVLDLEKGAVMRGYVSAVTSVGVFISLGRHVTGRVKISHLSDDYVKNFAKLYARGSLVRAKIIEIDHEAEKVELSLRLSDVDPKAAAAKEKKKRAKAGKRRKRVGSADQDRGRASSYDSSLESSTEDEELELCTSSGGSNDEGGGESEDEEARPPSPKRAKKRKRNSASAEKPLLTLTLPGRFDWTAADSEPESAAIGSSGDDEADRDEPCAAKKSRRKKRTSQKEEERRLFETENALLDANRVPESADDFDRLVVANPNSSALWMQYMVFYLHTAEIDKARAVAERALQTISFREEAEKLNVWVALLNLENLYGSQESLTAVFKRALQQNEPLLVFTKLVAIYDRSEKWALEEQLFQSMIKRFSGVVKVWTMFADFLLRRGKSDYARSLLQRSLKSLTKQQHVETISKFAQLEFRLGEPERGKTMFEGLLSSYPRRVDLWSVYVDMLMKAGDNYQQVRDVFERAINLKVSVQKMKFLFKRYLEFEKSRGSPAGASAVIEKAKAYIEARTGK